ncbi:MAG: GDP-mannose 4,6-dehydratase [Candidatus Sumerlaeota bacterium]|nr:GDP-mannose 4,6-dehydratase [Candidatus Sumerlaeota bacterium]
MSRALITGGCGFIGSHLAEALLDQGSRVEVIDDLSTGSILNIEHLKSDPSFSYVIGAVQDSRLMAELIDKADEVYHLAAAVGVKLVVDEPVRTIETNIRGSEVVLEHAARKGKKVLIASSSEVYGKSVKVPFREDDDMILGPTTANRWCYACSKAIDEFLALAYYYQEDLPVVITRFFNTVGPRQMGDYGMVVPRFVRQALCGQPLTVYGDGSMTRSFCHVRDTVRAVIALMDCDAAAGQVVNIGNDVELSVLDLARTVIERAESSSEINFVPFEDVYGKGFEDLNRRVPDLTRLRRLIEFGSLASIEEIIDDVIAYERNKDSQ